MSDLTDISNLLERLGNSILPPLEDALIEKTSTTTSRIGHTVERAVRMHDAGVSHRTIAAQLSDNSANHLEYTAAEIPTLVKLGLDCRTKVGITASQAQALIKDTKANNPAGPDRDPDDLLPA